MFQQKSKKRPPPRPPPPNFMKYKSKSSYNLAQTIPNLIEWSPPNSPKEERSHQFGGSVSSSYSSSTSSLTSSKKSLENDNSFFNFNWLNNTTNSSNVMHVKENLSIVRPRIIRPPPPKKIFTDTDESTDYSPPMPKVPPPSSPKGQGEIVTPYGIALYDFPATQVGDLPLQVNDVVVLVRRINKEWLYGKVCDKEGMFPENFIQIRVPLLSEDQIVTALYEFRPQMSEDLPLRPGQRIKVLREISQDWVFGESEGRTGQFPRNFVS